MKKRMFFVLAALCALFTVPSVAFAINYTGPVTHGNFAGNSKGCADCHVTHGASAAKLLKGGTNQTEFCFVCHGNAGISGFDVKNGKIQSEDGNTWNPSWAGGFNQAYDFGGSGTYKAVTSVHNVEKDSGSGTMPAGVGNGFQIPGGSGALSDNFRCGSCHNPHAGGTYDNTTYTSKNPRLLKKAPLGNDVPYMGLWTISNTTNNTGTNRVTAYGDGINAWCGACHGVFNTEGQGATGHTADGNGKYRHAMGVLVAQTGHTEWNAGLDSDDGIALDANGKLNCLSCHRAHGSSATTSNGFMRYTTYNGQAQSTSSVLLRLPERDVCYSCHGAAQYNKPS